MDFVGEFIVVILIVLQNGFLSSLPLLSMTLGIGVASLGADWCRSRKLMSITNISKAFQVSGT